MELLTYRQHNENLPGARIELLQLFEEKLNYHRRYRSIIRQLDTMIELLRQQPDRKLTPELNYLLDDMMSHIGSENRFMELVDYPQATKHRSYHYDILVTTDDLNQRFALGKYVLPDELANVRLLWMVHIQTHDRAFEEFLAF